MVAAPLYAGLRLTERRWLAGAEGMQRSVLRRWMIYLALLVSAAALLGDLVYVIYSLLIGDLTTKFLLKALCVAVVVGAVFLLHLGDSRTGEGS